MPPQDDHLFLNRLEVEVEVELEIAESSRLADALDVSPADWLFDPTDVEREQVGLGNLLGALEAVAGDLPADRPPPGPAA